MDRTGQLQSANSIKPGGNGSHSEKFAGINVDGAKRPTDPNDLIAKQDVLRERAKRLAQPLASADVAGDQIEVIEFLLAHERYAIESEYVREVYPSGELTPLPCAPAFVLGIISLRGEIISVIDMKIFFNLPRTEMNGVNRIIVVRSETMEFGIFTDALVGARKVSLATIQPPLPTLSGVGQEYLRGVTDEQVVILDGKRLLSDESIIVREEVGL